MPNITWTREDNRTMTVVNPTNGEPMYVRKFQGVDLNLFRVNRDDMGAFLCVANNGVPPTVRKRVTLMVTFQPRIDVPVHLLGTPLGGDITLKCTVQGYPSMISYWCRDGNAQRLIMNGTKSTLISTIGPEKWKTIHVLTIRNVGEQDLGVYTCEGYNSLDNTSADVRVYEIKGIELEQHHKTKNSKKIEISNNQTGLESSSRSLADSRVTIWMLLFCFSGALF
uniref:Lachesin n=1 Tax=Cacopsylla melanoneura TaxID=428564 RepID=A0A8D8Z791_9HEMI